MPIIKAAKIPTKTESAEDFLSRFCFYYPRYSYNQAKRMPVKRIKEMLKIVEKEQAKFMLNLLSIVTAPKTKKGKGVGKLQSYFKNIINGE